jgi:hypothetical protein
MREQQLQIHLRRRYVEQAQARRPRLPQRLRALGAVGPVVRPLAAGSQSAFVKTTIANGTTTGKHLAYLTHGKGRDQQDAALFGPATTDKAAFVAAAKQDPHQFRIVVQVPDQARLDRTRYIELVMAQVEQDFGRPLDWVAAHHYDTAYPHTHIALRGRDRDGKDLYMEKHYLMHGLRTRVAEVLTWLLGPVRQQQPYLQSDRLIYDGTIRGTDDPDTRARAMPLPQTFAQPQPGAQGPVEQSQADIVAQARARAEQMSAWTPGVRASSGASVGQVAAQLAVLQQLLQAQHQAQHQHGGWGYGQR